MGRTRPARIYPTQIDAAAAAAAEDEHSTDVPPKYLTRWLNMAPSPLLPSPL